MHLVPENLDPFPMVLLGILSDPFVPLEAAESSRELLRIPWRFYGRPKGLQRTLSMLYARPKNILD
jgi:hypothetical protein